MKSAKLLVQSLAVAICTALVFTGGTAAMACAVGTGSSPAVAAAATSNSGDCNGSSAFQSVSYTVNGVAVLTLAGNVTPGSTVAAEFVLRSECDNTKVGIASYQAVSAHGNTDAFSLQTLYGYNDNTFSGGVPESVSVVVPNCYFQVDFYTGTFAQPGDYYSPSGRLVSSAVGGTSSCVGSNTGGTTTTTVRPGSTTSSSSSTSSSSTSSTAGVSGSSTTTAPGDVFTATTTPNDVGIFDTTTTTAGVGGQTFGTTTTAGGNTTTTAGVGATGNTPCAAVLSGRISNYSVTSGGNTYPKFTSTMSGQTVTVHFTVAPNCKEQLSLASYQATSADTSPAGVLSQTLFDSDTGWFGPGSHTLTVSVPNCMYQIDFVEGAVITHFGPVGTNNYYAGRILDTSVGGTTSCVSAAEVTTSTTRPGETATTGPSNVQAAAVNASSGSTTSTTAHTTTTAANVEAAAVSPAQLAMTGIDAGPMLELAVGMIGLGAALMALGRRYVVRTVATGRHYDAS